MFQMKKNKDIFTNFKKSSKKLREDVEDASINEKEIKDKLFELKEEVFHSDLKEYEKNYLFVQIIQSLEYLHLSDIPNGREINSILFNNKDEKLGLIFYKDGLDYLRNGIGWFDKLFQKSNVLLDDKTSIMVDYDMKNSLIYTCNGIVRLSDNKMLWLRNDKDNVTQEFFSFLKFNENNNLDLN